ncbi:MAG: [FeFe] hydrogenase H-cluster radical SAM maturase HydG [Ignavibacteriae bacterium]|nr:[FeFe] hydrogenase H-cluster radical SAM maturase HydG [Ignavibacteriota bacterium]NOG99337.1 [FeFe] hydrogenase H-cluster radical SAM maturase HydG [Ignavibacteriota bacterium]
MEFINEKLINSYLQDDSLKNVDLQKEIIAKAKERKGITLEESAALLNITDKEIMNELFKAAGEIKQAIYGNRLVMFAPMYLSNACVNNCLYCAFRRDNKELARKTLTVDEVGFEAEALIKQGHKRLLLVCGEHPKESNLDFVGKAIERIYSIDYKGNNIRRVNVNIAPLSLEDFKKLHSFEIGTYQIFQETYHYDTYKQMHPSGPKKDYAWRLRAPERAFEAGIDDLGIGALFGLTDYKFETLAMLMHADYMDRELGVGPHTISIPRLEPAMNAPTAVQPPYAVDDVSFKKLIAILRLAVPYTGIILSTREKPELRRDLFNVGVSQISAGSKTSPGSYDEEHEKKKELEQFQLGDHRGLDEVVSDVCELGYLPSFCTSCYRSGRTGDRFMELAKSGNIGKICSPNALATFKEYLLDFASDETIESGENALAKQVEDLPEYEKKRTKKMIEDLKKGERDVYF